VTPRALIVDDDPDFAASLELLVAREGFDVSRADSLERARECAARLAPDVVLADLELPDGRGTDLLRDDALPPGTDFVVITGHASVDSAVAALREGVVDYLTKPIDGARLRAILANVARTRALRAEVESLRGELRELGRFGRMVGRSKAMQEVYDLIARVAPTDASVFLAGESGTGKELAAETIHGLSRRSQKPFLALNCGAVSPSLIESELFGHERGAFTGADRRRAGYFERADGGTLFLDEVTEMPAELQVKLLRVLESGRITRVGTSDAVAVDVRLIAATNRSPEDAVRSGKLREDLFYRLNVFPLALPPLRSRVEDIELLARHFLDALNAKQGVEKRWAPQALERLQERPWTGNVRELRNVVERAWILAEEEIGVAELADFVAAPAGGGAVTADVGTPIAEMERRLILATLEQLGGDKKKAAAVLGISLKTLYNRLSVYRASQRS
jgi:two-component system response regulator AtoC